MKDTNRVVKEFEEALADIISEHNAFVIATAKEINIPSRDLLCSSALHSFNDVSIERIIKSGTKRVKKEGLGGGVSRSSLAGFSVFYQVAELVMIGAMSTNHTRKLSQTLKLLRKKICTRLAEAYERYCKSMEEWAKKNFNRSMELIEAEIEASEKNYLRKKAAAVEMQSLAELDSALKPFIDQIRKDLPDSEFAKYEEAGGAVFSSKEIDVTPYNRHAS